MAKKYEKLVNGIVENIGGIDNLTYAGHCATRLRIKLTDMNKLNKDDLEKVPGVLGVAIQKGVEIQIIVGTDVLNVYADFLAITGYQDSNAPAAVSGKGEKEPVTLRTIGQACMNYLSGTVAPVIPIYLCAGMLMAVINMCTAFLGVDADNGAIVILNAVANAGFYFMPIVLGWSAVSKHCADPALGAMLGMALVYAEINGVEGLSFLGIPVYTVTYNSTFLPIILGAVFLSLVYKFFRDKIPQAVRYFLLPLFTMLVAVPVTLLLLGPAGYIVGTWMSVLFE